MAYSESESDQRGEDSPLAVFCCACHRRKIEDLVFVEVDEEVRAQVEPFASHGICPTCAQTLYGYSVPSYIALGAVAIPSDSALSPLSANVSQLLRVADIATEVPSHELRSAIRVFMRMLRFEAMTLQPHELQAIQNAAVRISAELSTRVEDPDPIQTATPPMVEATCMA
jgi:hypothetical protein